MDPIAALKKKFVDMIEQSGHAVISTSNNGMGYSYSVGLSTRHGYELIMMLLPSETMHDIINEMAARLETDTIENDVDINLPSYNVPFRLRLARLQFTEDGRAPLVNACYGMGYRPGFVRQIVWPDPNGRFEGDPGYDVHLVQDLDLLLD